jgi:2-polyprenyl-3-methyl-5-hydroxy-6-metoxy-1,4-benzoquinol methylase
LHSYLINFDKIPDLYIGDFYFKNDRMNNAEFEINRNAWNNFSAIHIHSGFYDLPAFLAGKNSLNAIELNLLGDISGKKILHLQCHFGQDSISLARMGASVTGIDFSDAAIVQAKELAEKTGTDATFICCNLYDLPKHLSADFDLVFTSYGTIAWLPDLISWAAIVNRYLKPEGKFVFVEFHPVVWMFNNDFTEIAYPYMNAAKVVEVEQGTYADRDSDLKSETITWNHGIGNVLSALLETGLQISSFQEFDYSPYSCFSGMLEREPGKFIIEKFGNKIPLVYAITAWKPGA